jgi:acyl-CoA thioester hydrolase
MTTYRYTVLWADLDANQHLKNTRYLDYAAQTRFRFLAEHGFTPDAFAAARVGPVVVEDRVRYLREFRLLEEFDVSIELVGQNESGSRFHLRNRFLNLAGDVCAEVWSHGAWFDLKERRIAPPPEGLALAMGVMPKAVDFLPLARRSDE